MDATRSHLPAGAGGLLGAVALLAALLLALPTSSHAAGPGLRLSLSARSVLEGGAVTIRLRPVRTSCTLRLHRGTSKGRVTLRRRVPRSGRVRLGRMGTPGRRTVVVVCGRRTAKAAFVVRARVAPASPPVTAPPAAPAPGTAPPPPGGAPPAPAPAPAPNPWIGVSRIAWDTVTPAPASRGEAQGAAVGGRLYVFGGFTSGDALDTTAESHAYDAAGGSWQRVPDMPVELTHAPVVVDGTTIWLLGGYVGDHPGPATAQVWKYDVATARWSAGPPLPAARGAGGAAIVGRELHFFGGTSRSGSNGDPDEGEHWVLGLDGGTTWQARAPLPNPRNHLAGVGLGGLVYAIGGQYGENETTGNQSQVDAYDPATNTWRPRAPLPAPRGHVSSSAVVVGGRIVVMGGTEQGNKASAAVAVYDPAANAWTSMSSLPDTRKTPVAGLLGAELYVATGSFRTATLRGRLLP